MTKIAYEVHPVTLERKKELRAQGYRILDARFAPKDDKAVGAPGPELTVDQAREQLTALGIEFGPRLQLPGLLKLLEEHEAAELEGIKTRLTEKGVEHDENASLEDLTKLLEEVNGNGTDT